MFRSLLAFFQAAGPASGEAGAPTVSVELATAVLLVEAMRADQGVSPEERAAIARALQDRFGLQAAQVQEFHRQLFTSASDSLRQEIKRITGVEVRAATTEVEPAGGTVVQVFTTGTVVQVFLLAHNIPAESWNGSQPDDHS